MRLPESLSPKNAENKPKQQQPKSDSDSDDFCIEESGTGEDSQIDEKHPADCLDLEANMAFLKQT